MSVCVRVRGGGAGKEESSAEERKEVPRKRAVRKKTKRLGLPNYHSSRLLFCPSPTER